ncbi:MAG: hypothetical protein QOE36_45 [Gaiellaceae bacterium]|jgi:hypothetical protein|nr:hypothetical protein [Gaiellaceae bacterium]MDX6570392.1 hypothetical protein [Gaiellales bacterium]
MDVRSSVRGFATPRRGASVIAAVACFAVAAAAAAAVLTLVLVRDLHANPAGGGYWTDVFGFRAGVDNVGFGTVVSVFLNWHLHWQHNLAELGTVVVGLLGYGLGKSYWEASKDSTHWPHWH